MNGERPILFAAPMVRALLDGTKTRTRRIVKPQPTGGDGLYRVDDDGFVVGRLRDSENAWRPIDCPYGVPGDRLYVRETWAPYDGEGDRCTAVEYRADGAVRECPGFPCRPPKVPRRWRPSIHMPRLASRIALEITNVRVERVEDISEDDACAEGVFAHKSRWRETFLTMFFETTRAKPDSNPWVWVIEFKRAPLCASLPLT